MEMVGARRAFVGLLFIALVTWPLLAVAKPAAKAHRAVVVLAWDGSGDFGPSTPGTKTAGWQEAIDYCVAHGRDLYVQGGWGGRKAIYNISQTIHIPATQDFRIDGGIYVLNWKGPASDPSKDLMLIDSTMNGEYHFGIFVYGGAGAAMRIRPEKPVPIDGFPVVVETVITSEGMADPFPFKRGERKAGTGLVLDGTQAPIVSSRFDFIGGILNFKTCIRAKGQFSQCHFNCLHLHTNADKSTLFVLGPDCAQNVVKVDIGVDMGAAAVKGIDILGCNNTFEIMTRGGFPRGDAVILERPAQGNRIDLIHGEINGAFDPGKFITDHAAEANNQITWSGRNIAPMSIKATAGHYVYTQRLYPATVRLVGGKLTALKLVRGADIEDRINAPRADMLLSVGDQLRITSTVPPIIRVRPFKTK